MIGESPANRASQDVDGLQLGALAFLRGTGDRKHEAGGAAHQIFGKSHCDLKFVEPYFPDLAMAQDQLSVDPRRDRVALQVSAARCSDDFRPVVAIEIRRS